MLLPLAMQRWKDDVKRLSRQLGLETLPELQQHLQIRIWVAVMIKLSILPPVHDASFYSAAYEGNLHGQPFSCHPHCRLQVFPLPALHCLHGKDRAERHGSHLEPMHSIYASDLQFLDRGS